MTISTRKAILTPLLAALAVTLLAAAPVHAQAQDQAQRVYAQAELDQMLAPIALYPDALLSQMLMAATYPIEVVEAARWSRANPGLQGEDAVRAVQNQDWDPSVKSLVAFPEVLGRMDEQPEWTRSLGDAFLAQEPDVMDAVQQLRQRARATGELASDERLNVIAQPDSVTIQPVNPQVVYVPYYDPRVVYGPWWWPAYQPVVWAPWPGYVRAHRAGVAIGFWWGAPHRWQHEPQHRRGADYRAPEVRQRFASPQIERRLERRAEMQPAPVQAQPTPKVRAPAARPQAQARPQPEARPQPQVRQAEQRPSMPAAQAPQTPRAESEVQRHEHREPLQERRQERREERGRKTG